MKYTMFDSEYVIIGSLAGSIVTLENETQENFRMACPKEELLPTERLHK